MRRILTHEETRRGVRLDKRPGRNKDGMIALLTAVDRMEQKPSEPMRLLGWI